MGIGMSKKHLHRITIDLPKNLHKDIKIVAAQYERSLRDIIIESIILHPYFYRSVVEMAFPGPLLKDRDPDENDIYEVGTIWMNGNSYTAFISEVVENGKCFWRKYEI